MRWARDQLIRRRPFARALPKASITSTLGAGIAPAAIEAPESSYAIPVMLRVSMSLPTKMLIQP